MVKQGFGFHVWRDRREFSRVGAVHRLGTGVERMRMRRRRWLVIGLGICWLAAVTAGLVLLHGYAAQAGQRGVAHAVAGR